VHFSAAKIV